MALLTNINGKFSVSDAGAVTFNNAFTFPTTDGAANYVLQTNGSGQLAWALNGNGDISGSGTANTVTKFTGSGTGVKTIGDGPITFSGNNSTFAGNLNLPADKYILIGTDSGDPFNGSSAIRIQDSSHAYVQMKVGNSSQGGVLIGNTTDDYLGGFTYSNSSESLVFKTANTDALTIDSSQNATFAGILKVDSTNPIFLLNESDQTANNRLWGLQGQQTLLKIRAYPDDLSSAVDVLTFTRTGDSTFAGDVTVTGGDLTLGTDSIASNINAVGDVLGINVDSNTGGGAGANIQLKTAGTTQLTINNSSATFAGTVTAPTFSGDLNGTINTVTTATTKGNSTNDTTVATTAFVQNVVGTIPAGLVFQGTWNASTNSPTLTSGSGTTGHFYIVSVAGSTNLDGITDWQVGDWAVFIEQGASDQWEKIDNSSVLGGSGTGGSFAGWSGSGTSVTLGNAPVTFSGNNSAFIGHIAVEDGNNFYGANAIAASSEDGNYVASFGKSTSGSAKFAGNITVGAGNSSFAGNVTGVGASFIGTAASGAALVTIENNSGSTATSYGLLVIGGGNSSNGRTFEVRDASGNTDLIVKGNGNVGIGTASPLAELQVGLSTSNAGNRSTLAMFGAAESGILNALSLVNTTGAAATGYGTRINFHLSSNYSPTGCIEVVTEDLTANATDSTMRFSTYGTIGSSVTYQSRLEISSAGAIKFNDYNSTKQTGTPTYMLGTDASGNVVKVLGSDIPGGGGTVTGSGAATQVAFWDGTSSLSGNNDLYWDNTIGGLGINDATPGSRLKVIGNANDTSIYTVDINHIRNDANVATHAMRLNVDLSGADTTTADRTNSGLFVDIDSSANGDLSNEHRIYGVNTTVNFSGFSDLVRGGYFLAESNYTGAKTTQLVGVYGYAIHDANDVAGGVSNMYGVFGISSVQDKGDVDNAFGVYGQVSIGTNRTEDVGVTKGVEGEIAIDKDTELNYGTMIAISGVIDNNEGSVPNFGNQYLFKGDYQGTTGPNAYGVYCEGDKHYFDGKVGIGVTSPDTLLHIYNPSTDWGAYSTITLGTDVGGTNQAQLKYYRGASTSTESFQLSVRGTTSLTALYNGNVGIGTTSPQSKLHIETGSGGTYTPNVNHDDVTIEGSGNIGLQLFSPATSYQYIAFGDPGSVNAGYLRYYHGTNEMVFRTNGSDNMVINSAGNVGIGTTSPGHKLEVIGRTKITESGDALRINSSDANGSYATWQNNGTALGYVGSGYHLWSSPNNIATSLGIRAQTRLDLGIQASVHMTILNSGNVGIGTTSPGYTLEIAGPSTTSFAYQRTGVSANKWGFHSDNDATYWQNLTSGNLLFTLQNGGNVGIGTTSPTNYKLEVNGNVKGDSFGTDQSTTARIFAPSGAAYNGSGSQTGYLIIKLPDNGASGINNMMSGLIRVFDYAGNESFDVHFAGYWYSGYNWTNCTAWIESQSNTDRNFNVRFGAMTGAAGSGTRPYITIGEGDSTWSYCKFSVMEYTSGHSNAALYKWNSGWEMALSSTAPGVTARTVANCQGNNWAREGQNIYYGSGTGNVGIGTTSGVSTYRR